MHLWHNYARCPIPSVRILTKGSDEHPADTPTQTGRVIQHPADTPIMRTSINLPDEVIATVRDRAAADGITPAEWMRRAILEAVTPRHPDEHPAGTPGNTPDETPIMARDGTITRADVLASDLDTMTAERDRAREDLDTLRTRADQAEAVAAERLTRIAELRADLDAERERSRSDVIQAAALAVRAALPSSTTTDETTRRTIRERVRDWLNR